MMNYTKRGEFIAGIRDTLPMDVGAIPFGIIFGALAVNSGISPLGTMGLSLFVFAGSSQFVATGLVAQGVSTLIIIVTTFILNVRHVLYSATLAPHVKGLGQKWLLPLGFWLTDETFAVVVTRYNQPDASPYKHWYHLGSSIVMYVNWNVCTLIGLVAGQSIPDLSKLGLDFAMSVTFIGLLVPQLKNRPMLLAAVVAGVSAVLFYGLPNKMGLMVAALSGIAAGILAEHIVESQRHKATPAEKPVPEAAHE
jgi:4-azaleucine resistance transporter AzlC